MQWKQFIIAASLTFSCSAVAQTRFDVASVKRSPTPSSTTVSPIGGGRISATGVSLRALIRMAYGIQDFQITGAERWMETERFDIDAKGRPEANTEDTRSMLKTLLAERFGLETKREDREVPSLDLIVSSEGVGRGLTSSHTPDCPTPDSNRAPDDCSNLTFGPNGLVAKNVTMAQLAQAIAAMTRSPVVDNTGLSERYDFRLQVTPQAPPPGGPGGAADTMDLIQPIVYALQEQLGLKLRRTKTPIDMIVIISAQRPSPN